MIKKYALPIFFQLAYLFTWSNWLPQALKARGIASVQAPGFLTLLAGYGPALAAIIVASLAYGRQGLRELFGRLLRCPLFRRASKTCVKFEKLPSGTVMEVNSPPGAKLLSNLWADCSEKSWTVEFSITKL